jgi:hypothetical protein
MSKLRLSSWLHGAPSTSEKEQKKQNRRSFAGFSTRPRDHLTNGKPTEGKPEPENKAIRNSDPATSDSGSIVALAKKIAQESEKLEAYLKENGLPTPGFAVDSPKDFPKLPPDLQRSRKEIIHATRKLGDLVRGTTEGLRWQTWGVSPPT